MPFSVAEYVVGLYVAVHDVLFVEVFKPGCHIPDESPCCLLVGLSDYGDGRGWAVRHHEERPVFANVEMVCVEEIGVIQGVSDLVLGLEFLYSPVVECDIYFYGDFEVEAFVLGEPDLAERTAADFPDQAVSVVEQCIGLKFHICY